MQLAIFADSHAVAGDVSLLAPLKRQLQQHMANHTQRLSAFTRPALQFTVPLTLFGHLKADKAGLDIKQGGFSRLCTAVAPWRWNRALMTTTPLPASSNSPSATCWKPVQRPTSVKP
ncbi:predicted signal-transduction protein containing cAMP-binding and CBS domains [Photobacterium aphoticum]|uniref:Predicted signal-transduction protein containing cAMP-binding and CBS domains n=1 Tax=Photobacterium aphoticum TaxID=754436 RepID=A0A090QZL5_9GAMM|nr:predicted signal-transduction protein containing cAMP-binding and CBS domains [Photobacterium aphoticum]